MTSPESQYRGFYDGSPDMFVTIDRVTRVIVDCNPALCAALGYEKAELEGARMATIDLADSIDTEVADAERRLRRKDGSTLEVSLSLRGAFLAYRDITRRKQEERDRAFLLRIACVLQRPTSAEQIFRAVSGELGVYLGVDRAFFFSVDPERSHGAVNPGYTSDGQLLPPRVDLADFTAKPGDPHLATELTLAVPNLRDGRWTASLVVTQKQPRAWAPREIALVRRVAERVWLSLEHLRVVAQGRDRDIAAAVERTEERYGVLLEGVKDCALFMLDPYGRVITWNAGAQRLKQYRTDEVIGQPYAVFFSHDDLVRGRPHANLERAAKEGRFEEEGWRIRKDGSRFWASVLLTAIRGDDGMLEGFAEVAREVRTAEPPRPSSDRAASADA